MVTVFAGPHLVLELDYICADWAFVPVLLVLFVWFGRGGLHSFAKLIVEPFIEGIGRLIGRWKRLIFSLCGRIIVRRWNVNRFEGLKRYVSVIGPIGRDFRL